MCGIAGFSCSASSSIDTKKLISLLFDEIKDIGMNASGAAWCSTDGLVDHLKSTEEKTIFKSNLQQRINLLPGLLTSVVHTRRETQGSSRDSRNNHPIHVDGIFGIHSGDIENEEYLYTTENIDRIADVDSAIIFHLAAKGGDLPREKLRLIKGTAAVAWFRTDNPTELHLATTEREEMALGQVGNEIAIFAKSTEMVEKVCSIMELHIKWLTLIPDYTHLMVRGGQIVDMGDIGV